MLETLSVKNLRCIEAARLDLTPVTEAGSGWTLLVGENGTGKSTLLQALVIGSLGVLPLANLVPDAWTMCRQHAAGRTEIAVRAAWNEGRPAHTYGKRLSPKDGSYFQPSTKDPKVELPLLLGFAARRRIALPDERPRSRNLEIERVRGLFAVDHPLLAEDPFTALDESSDRRRFAKVFRDVAVHRLKATDARMFPLVDSIELRGNGGIKTNEQLMQQKRFILRYGETYSAQVAIQQLSDGYQAMLAIVLEILVQAALAEHDVPDPADLRALVLIDEIEAHLHPRWQRTVVDLLREVFPLCQFVATTHSPLIVSSARQDELRILRTTDDGAVSVETLEESLSGLAADDIYEIIFGVPRAAPPSFVRMEREVLSAIANRGEPPASPALDLVREAWADARRLTGRDDRT